MPFSLEDKIKRKKPTRFIFYLPIIAVFSFIGAFIGMVLVCVVFVSICVLSQWISMGIGLISGSLPWEIMTFFRDGEFVFELTPDAFALMETLSRWVGILGGAIFGIYLSSLVIKKIWGGRV